MRYLFSLLLLFLFPLRIFASPVFSSLLPNPAGDDTLGEYIEIRNTGCSMIDISGFEIRDLQRGYIFPSATHIESKTNLKIEYAISKISLNNSGLETISLKDASGTLVDSYSYSGTQKDNIVLNTTVTDDVCDVSIPVTESTGTIETNTGIVDTGSLLPAEGTGSISGENMIPIVSSEIPESTGSTLISSGSEVSSGTLIDSGGILENTGTLLSPEIGGSTGTMIESTGSGEIYTETGLLIPLELEYSDSDHNNKIDTLEILYPYVLTGIVNTGAILLFSRSGGLSLNKIDTQTGYILSGSLSGNMLILSLLEGDLLKTDLYITNSTTSDLRLKSTLPLGFGSIGGQVAEYFLLTSSFDNYTKVSKKISPNQDILTSTGISDGTGGIVQTGVVSTGSSINFPDVIPFLQSPTNAFFSSGVFVCRESTCRINLTLESIFSSGYSMKEYFCYFGTGGILELDTDCNPNTYYFSSSGSLSIELVSRLDPKEKKSQMFPILWDIASSNATQIGGMEIDTNPPVIMLEIDGKWHSYYKQISEYEFECYTFTCAINLTAERSYDSEGGEIRYMWMYDMMNLTEKKDPGEKKFSLGDHVIWLRVIDNHENMSEVFFRISVLGDQEKEEKTTLNKTSTRQKKIKEISKTQKGEKKKKLKMKKFLFFDPPKIILQSKDSKTKKYTLFKCVTTSKTCSFNLTLQGTMKNIVYHWYYSDGTEVTSKNPGSKTLTPGIHTVLVTASYIGSDVPLWSETLQLEVHKIKKPKKSKKVKKKTPKKTSPKKEKNKKVESQDSFSPFIRPREDTSIPYELFYLLFGATGVYVFRRKFFPKLSTFREQDKDTEI